MWHWTGQCFRLMTLLYSDFGPKDWRWEITWQAPVLLAIIFCQKHFDGIGGGLLVFLPLLVYVLNSELGVALKPVKKKEKKKKKKKSNKFSALSITR